MADYPWGQQLKLSTGREGTQVRRIILDGGTRFNTVYTDPVQSPCFFFVLVLGIDDRYKLSKVGGIQTNEPYRYDWWSSRVTWKMPIPNQGNDIVREKKEDWLY